MSIPPLSERFDAALIVASSLHRTQRRKGNDTPYLAHLLVVAGIVLDNGGDEDTAIAALLHDAVEDQGGITTLEVIREKFGLRVADIVWACSDNEGEPKRPWLERKKEFVASIPKLTPEARLVAMADKLHNMRSLIVEYRRGGEDVWHRFNGLRNGTIWYYRAVMEQFRLTGREPLIDELIRSVDELFELIGEPRV